MVIKIIFDILCDGLFAAIAGIGFGAISNPPRRSFLYIGLLAALGHATRFCLMHYAAVDITSASFIAGLVIGFFSVPFGRISHSPASVLYIPALLPMIPGKFAYNTLFSIMKFLQTQNDTALATEYLNKTFSNGFLAFSIIFFLAVGATLPALISPKRVYGMTRYVPKNKLK